jgi:hypothetical protein
MTSPMRPHCRSFVYDEPDAAALPLFLSKTSPMRPD